MNYSNDIRKARVFFNGVAQNAKPLNKRNPRGEWIASLKTRIMRFVRKVTYTAGIIAVGYALFSLGAMSAQTVSYARENIKEVAVSDTSAVIRKAQDAILTQLSLCENPKQDSGIIVFDSNKVASIGNFQWQLKSVKHYTGVKTDAEALAIASSPELSRELARKVIFEQDGLKNWLNCANKLDLRAQKDLIDKIK